MDWIERWFGFEPDGGDGSLEWLITVVVLSVIILGIVWRTPRARAALVAAFQRLQRAIGGDGRR